MKAEKEIYSSTTIKIKINFIVGNNWKKCDIEYREIGLSLYPIVLAATGFTSVYKNAEVNVKLSEDDEIKILNKEFRGYDKSTNVLSFPNIMFDITDFASKINDYDGYIGDIIISLDTIKKEALEQRKSLKNHYAHILCHGILHLLGYDHIDETQAKKMEQIEKNILNCLNIPNPYLN